MFINSNIVRHWRFFTNSSSRGPSGVYVSDRPKPLVNKHKISLKMIF